MNQFTAPKSADIHAEFLLTGKRRSEIESYVAFARHSSTENTCLLPEGNNALWFRRHGKRHKLSVRNLVYYAFHGELPVLGPATCGNAGCINPQHQAPHKKSDEKEE